MFFIAHIAFFTVFLINLHELKPSKYGFYCIAHLTINGALKLSIQKIDSAQSTFLVFYYFPILAEKIISPYALFEINLLS